MVEPRDAATVLLVRDGLSQPAIEVFMLRRNPRLAFVAGAYVFPGGGVDLEDRSPATFALVDGVDETTASSRLGRGGAALGFWVAAIREAFEEAGVLLARERATGDAVRTEVAAELQSARAGVAAGEQSFASLVVEHGLVLDGGSLRVLSHWITPPGPPRRYDTWFFVAPAPSDQTYLHDDDETVASEWLTAADALERSRRGDVDLIYPTYRTLQTIGRFATCAELLEALDEAWSGTPDALRPVGAANGWQVRLPRDEIEEAADEVDARAHSVGGLPREEVG